MGVIAGIYGAETTPRACRASIVGRATMVLGAHRGAFPDGCSFSTRVRWAVRGVWACLGMIGQHLAAVSVSGCG